MTNKLSSAFVIQKSHIVYGIQMLGRTFHYFVFNVYSFKYFQGYCHNFVKNFKVESYVNTYVKSLKLTNAI